MKRPLSETLAELVDGLAVPSEAAADFRIRSVGLDLPIEIGVGPEANPILLADLPGWRWPTDFDVPPARLRVRLGEGGPW